MIYTPPALTACNFALTAYTPPAVTAVNFELSTTPPTVGPFPHFTRRAMLGGMIGMKG
jgi:hypothetical protein